MISCLALSGDFVIICPHDYQDKSPPAFDSSTAIIGSFGAVLCFRETGRSLTGRGIVSLI